MYICLCVDSGTHSEMSLSCVYLVYVAASDETEPNRVLAATGVPTFPGSLSQGGPLATWGSPFSDLARCFSSDPDRRS